MVLAAEIWHYWIGVSLVLATIAVVVAIVIAYLVKVERPRYPRHGQEAPLPVIESGE
jgi:hypothetical protein